MHYGIRESLSLQGLLGTLPGNGSVKLKSENLRSKFDQVSVNNNLLLKLVYICLHLNCMENKLLPVGLYNNL